MINYYWISVKGKNPKTVLNSILNEKVNVLCIKYLENELLIKISYNDYNKLKLIKTAYDIKIVKISGKKKIYEDIIKYKIAIISFILSVILLLFLSSHIFYIKIDTNNGELKKIVQKSLKKEDITIFSRKKSFSELKQIRDKIKSDNLNRVEWIELSNDGVIFNVKIIEKIEKYNDRNMLSGPTDIVAKRNGYIKKIEALNGDVLKSPFDFVEKGDVIISGNIIKNDEIVARTKAQGKVYAEVWYIMKLSKSLNYIDLVNSNKMRYKIVLKINNRSFNLLNIRSFRNKESNNNIFSSKMFSLSTSRKKEYVKKEKKYKDYEVVFSLKNKAKNDMLKTLDKNEYIIEEKTLKKYKENDKITIEVLLKVYEQIGQTVKAKEEIEKEE